MLSANVFYTVYRQGTTTKYKEIVMGMSLVRHLIREDLFTHRATYKLDLLRQELEDLWWHMEETVPSRALNAFKAAGLVYLGDLVTSECDLLDFLGVGHSYARFLTKALDYEGYTAGCLKQYAADWAHDRPGRS